MAETEEMVVSGVRVQIDRSLCVGFGDCVSEAPEAFRLDDEDLAIFGENPAGVGRERLVRACDVCPVDALTVWDEEGRQLIP